MINFEFPWAMDGINMSDPSATIGPIRTNTANMHNIVLGLIINALYLPTNAVVVK